MSFLPCFIHAVLIYHKYDFFRHISQSDINEHGLKEDRNRSSSNSLDVFHELEVIFFYSYNRKTSKLN